MSAWARRMLAVAAATLVISGLVVPLAPDARAADLFGYTLTAVATPVSMLYDQPSFGIPATPTMEVRNVYSRAVLDSGPSAYGLSSLVWPGDVIANAPPAMAFDVLVFDPTAGGYLSPATDEITRQAAENTADADPYPIRAESSYPAGGKATGEAGVARMESEATSTLSWAKTTTQRNDALASVFSYGSLRSFATSFVKGGVATAEATSYLSDVDLFGQIHFDSIVTTTRATSDGATGATSGTTKIAGMTIGGQAFTVDERGLHLGGQTQDPYGSYAKQYVDQHLAPHGIAISVSPPIEVIDGASATRSVGLVQVSLSSSGMEELFANVPQPYRDWIRSPSSGPLAALFDLFVPQVEGYATTPVAGDQTMTWVFGGAAVSSAASPEFDFDAPEVPELPVDAGPAAYFPPSTGGAPPSGAFAPPASVRGRRVVASPAGKPVPVHGVPAQAVAGALVLAAIGVARLRRFAVGVGASGAATAGRCPDSIE